MRQRTGSSSAAGAAVCRVICLFLTGLSVIVAGITRDAAGAEFNIQPSLMLSEEYNDNILLVPVDKKEEYITRVIPAVVLTYKAPRWRWDVDYALDYRHFERRTVKDDTAHKLNLLNHTEVVENVVFLDVSDNISRASLDITRDYTQQSLIVNQAQQNIFTVHPYMVLKTSATTSLTLGYVYRNTRYSSISDTTAANWINRTDYISYAELTADISSRVTFTVGTRHTRDQNSVEDYNQIDVYGGPQFTYAEKSFVYFLASQSWLAYEHGQKASELLWLAGITHHLLNTITVSLEHASLFIEDPQRVLTEQDTNRATIRHDTARTVLTVSGGLVDYKDARSKELISRSHDVQGTLLYRFSPRTSATAGTGFQRVDDRTAGSSTNVGLSSLRIDRLLSETLTLAGEYRYLHSYSPGIPQNNYDNNRYIVEIKKRF